MGECTHNLHKTLGLEEHSCVCSCLILILAALAPSSIAYAHVISVDPRATYLRTNEDAGAVDAAPLTLSALGFVEGDYVRLERLGAFKKGVDPTAFPDSATPMGGVFSTNGVLLPSDQLHRVSGAIEAGVDYVTRDTYWEALPTDIGEDFEISDIVLQVPLGATHLFFAAMDNYYSDNSDPNSDFALRITRVLLVEGTTITLWGNHQYDAIYVINNGQIIVPPAVWNPDIQEWEGGYLMLEADTIYVDSTSSISADACGFSKDDGHSDGGPGAGADLLHDGGAEALKSADGAGYGGRGGHSQTTVGTGGLEYGGDYWDQDDTRVDSLFGSAGGELVWQQWPFVDEHGPGGRGGGYIRLRGGTVTIEGTVSANGGNGGHINIEPSTFGGGGGSGGQIVLDSADLTVTGAVTARGGDGSSPASYYSGGGGAGGRIKILQPSAQICSGIFSVSGGGGCGGMGVGEPGTLYMPNKPPSDPPTALSLFTDDDTGRSNFDRMTKLATPRISGTGPGNSIIRLYEGGSLVGSGYSESGGSFTANVTSSLSNGVHVLTATAEGICNSESPQSTATVEITVDTVAPAVPSVPDLAASSDTGSQDDDNITRDWGPQFVGTCDPDADVTLYEDSVALGTGWTDSGTWAVTSSMLTEGNHSISASVTDAAGNESAKSGALSILVDLTAPTISQTSFSPITCWPAGKVFSFAMTASDGLSGMAGTSSQKVSLRIDTLEITFSMQSGAAGQYSTTWDSDGQPAGNYEVVFRALDIAGNDVELSALNSLCLLAAVPADLDHDGDVDHNDYDLFELCASGPGISVVVGCEDRDFDSDSGVDQTDFAIFQRCLSGENVPANPNCAN